MNIVDSPNLIKPKKQLLDIDRWSKLVAEWKNSNESLKEFCNRLNLNINTFTYIKNKLALTDKKKNFIPLTIRKDICPASHLNIILENPKGLKLHFNSINADDNLIKLLKMVGWEC